MPPFCHFYDYLIPTGLPFSNIYTVCIGHTLEIISFRAEIHPHEYINLCVWNIAT